MSVLKLKLLGQIECRLPSGELLSLSTRKSEVLLSYLAMAPGVRHPRDRLINLLWSDRGEDQARNSLRQSLSSIKKAFETEVPELFHIDRTTIKLDVGLIQVDSHEFEQLIDEPTLGNLAKAAQLYQGEFLEGITIRDTACQDWLANERDRLRRLMVEALFNLSQLQIAESQYLAAIESAERLVEYDPLQESGWRLLMTAYHQKGDRNHALMTYKRCCEILKQELGVEPEAETSGLQEQIKQGENSKPANLGTPDKQKSEPIKPASESTNKDHSIAVLPFDNLSGDPEQEYFSDGITESIILNLSLFPGLQVKSRNSSFAFKQQIKSLGEISEELNVDYVVEGSIRKSADRIRITVQLIEAENGNHIWGKRYDSDLSNLFGLEEELSRTIAATVTGRIEFDLQRIALLKPAAHQQSYELLLAGMYHCKKSTAQDMAIAGKLLDQCLELDPDNARAHALLYYCHSMSWLERWVEDYNTAFKLAGEHARKALELNPEAGYTQVVYAEYLVYSREFDKAETHVNRALEINPNDTEALTTKALVLENQSKFESALELIELAYELDPYHPWADWILAECQIFLERYEEALETISKSKNAPGFIRINNIVANIRLGRKDMARQALQEFLRECRVNMVSMPQNQDEWLRYITDNGPWSDSRINQDLIDCMVQAGLEEEMASDEKQGDFRQQPSIVVLPFDNLSGDSEQEYFSDGITESIILNLSLFPGLLVKSRNSSFAFKEQIKSLGEISKELNVDYMVEGSIRKSSEHIRITVQLIEAKSGNQIWGKRYDSELKNIFDVEEELSRTIAVTVTGRIESDLQRIALTKPASHQQSYDLLLSGKYHCYKFTREDMVVAQEKLEACLVLDPTNVQAHALLYECHIASWFGRWVVDYEQAFKTASDYIHKALKLDPEVVMVQIFYAEYLILCRENEAAARSVEKVLSMNANNPDALATKAFNLIAIGKYELALETSKNSMRLDPYNPWGDWIVAESQLFTGDPNEAIKTILNSKTAVSYLKGLLVVAYSQIGDKARANQTMQQFLQMCRDSMLSMPSNRDEWINYWSENLPYRDTEMTEDLIGHLMKAGLCDDITEATDDMPSIAVLPFENMSGDPEQEYFSDGITASLILNLGLYKGLAIKSRQSSFAFKESSKTLEKIAKELKVDFLIEGSIRKSGSNIRIFTQLIESSSGNQVWGKQYNSALEEIFELEQELSQTIAATISGRIGHKLQQSAVRKPAKNLKSYDYLLRGLYHMGKFNAVDMENAREQVEKCIEIDPENAEAHMHLAMIHSLFVYENWSTDRAQSVKNIRSHNEKALALAPDNAQVHAYLSEEYLIFQRDYDLAEFHANKSIDLNPTAAEGYTVKADLMSFTHRYDEALELADLCFQLDPNSVGAGWVAGNVHMFTGDYAKALTIYRSIIHPPASILARIAACLAGLDKFDQAKTEIKLFLKNAREQMPNCPDTKEEWRSYWAETNGFKFENDFEEFFVLLLKAGLCDQIIDGSNDMPSIAVLPFENMSGDSEQEYFSDGITESIILSLSSFTGLAVKSRHTSFAYKEAAMAANEIGEKLEVRYIVEGSIRKHADQIRITVQLGEASSGNQIWGKRYEASLEKLFSIEEELVQTIVGTISGRIGKDLISATLRKPARDMQSHDYLMRGIYHFHKSNNIDSAIAKDNFLKCIEHDPDNAQAHAYLAMSHLGDYMDNWSENRQLSIELCQQHVEKALEQDPDNAYAHAVKAELLLYIKVFDRAEQHAEKAIELNSTLLDGYLVKSSILAATRRHEEALKYADISLHIDPYHPYSGWYAGEVYRAAGDYERAIEIFRSIPYISTSVHGQIAACLAGLGKIEEARIEIRLYLEFARKQMPYYPANEEEWRVYWKESLPYQHEEDSETLFDLLLKAGLCD